MRMHSIYTHVATFDPAPVYTTLALLVVMSWMPWTSSAKRVARLKGHKRKPLEPIKDWKIFLGDLVSQ